MGLRGVLIGLLIAAGSGVVAALALAFVLHNAARFGLVQAPNARSSHVRPTPTGGGVGIVLGGSFAALFALAGQVWPTALILLSSLGFAGLGLWDDLRPLPAVLRLAVQLLLVAATVAFAVPLATLATALGWSLPLPALLVALVLVVVYWVNLYNFMDGIDGLAASEAAFLLVVPLGLTLAGVPGAAAGALFWWQLGLALAAIVFLAANWQPAKIFMGDVGSTFLGFMIAVFGLLAIAAGALSLWEALILIACFATDGTVTLLHRALRGERVMTAHRRHAYQHLARRFGSHQPVVLAITAINFCWLLPLVLAAHAERVAAPLLTLLAYAPLVALALLAGAGRAEHA